MSTMTINHSNAVHDEYFDKQVSFFAEEVK